MPRQILLGGGSPGQATVAWSCTRRPVWNAVTVMSARR